MWTGRQTLSEIESTIDKLHRDEGQLDGSLNAATAEAERMRHELGEAYRALAGVKLAEMEAGRLVRNLDAAESRAAQILESRRLRLANATDQRTAAIGEVEQAERARHDAAGAVEAALAEVEAVRTKAEADVKSTPAWVDASKAIEASDKIATEAEKKAAQSEDELRAKRKPYDDDPLFAYLWANGFGTPKYSAGNLVRMVDRSLAEFIGFSSTRPNYAMLLEIPLRLREHATVMRADTEDKRKALASLERQAMVAAGIEPKEKALAEARHRLAAADDTAEKKRAILKSLDEQRAQLVEGAADGAYDIALKTIADAAAQSDLDTLRREAARTATNEDDAIVQRIADIEAKLAASDKEIADLRATARGLAQRRLEVEKTRDRFRSAGFDHPNVQFGNESEIGSVLGQVLEGVLRSGILWDILRGGYSTRPPTGRPDFGAPSFPFPFPMPGGDGDGARGGQWRQPGTRGGWSPPFDMPQLPPSGGGGGGGGGSSSSSSSSISSISSSGSRGDDDGGFSTGGSF